MCRLQGCVAALGKPNRSSLLPVPYCCIFAPLQGAWPAASPLCWAEGSCPPQALDSCAKATSSPGTKAWSQAWLGSEFRHLSHPQPSLGSTFLVASSCPTVVLALPPWHLLSHFQLPPGAQNRMVLSVNFAPFLMFSSLHPPSQSCLSYPLPLQPRALTAPVPIHFPGAPHHCPAAQHTSIPLNVLAWGRKKQMAKQPGGFAFFWGGQRETAVTWMLAVGGHTGPLPQGCNFN